MRARAGHRQQAAERGIPAFVDRQLVVEPAVNLKLRDRADPDADAHGRHAPEITLQARHRVLLVVCGLDTALDEYAAGTDRLRVFGRQRTLLGNNGSREREQGDEREHGSRTSTMVHSSLFRIVCGYPREA